MDILITLIKESSCPTCGDGLVQVDSPLGSIVINLARLVELTPFPGDPDFLNVEQGLALMEQNLLNEILRRN